MVAIIVAVLITVGLIAIVVVKPEITRDKGGKVLTFVALFILPIVALGLGAYKHYETSKTNDFCFSCHVMKPYGESLFIDW